MFIKSLYIHLSSHLGWLAPRLYLTTIKGIYPPLWNICMSQNIHIQGGRSLFQTVIFPLCGAAAAAGRGRGLAANATVAFLRLFCRLSPHISCKTNTFFDHIAIDLRMGCTSETCWAANPSCSRTETVLAFFLFLNKMSSISSEKSHYLFFFFAFFLLFFPHLTLISLNFAPSTKLPLTLSLQWRLSVRRYESSRDLRELWHGLSYLVSSLHGRQLERHYEGTILWCERFYSNPISFTFFLFFLTLWFTNDHLFLSLIHTTSCT